MLSVFGDESSDETKSRVFAVAGVVGTEKMWEDLDSQWVARIAGVPFHAKDCESDKGDYERADHKDNQALYRDLTTLLAASEISGWGIAINLEAQRAILPDAPDLAYYKGFSEVISTMIVFAAKYQQPVKFTFDMRQESDYNSAFLYKMYRERPEVKVDMFRSVTFACSRDEPGIQVADLWTRECMKALDNQVGPVKREKRKSWAALESTGRFKIEGLGEEWFLSLREQLAGLQRESGIEPVAYNQWLNRNRLQNNTTNLFRFFEWTMKQRGL